MTEVSPNYSLVARLLDLAVEEDLGSGDLTSTLIDAHDAHLVLVNREPGVIAGTTFIPEILSRFAVHTGSGLAQYQGVHADGSALESFSVVGDLTGSSRTILSAERTILNLVTHLSGIATLTHKAVAQTAGTRAQIRDTRKTLPGLRVLEKYAVRCGGGVNHRMGLYDAILIKDNHTALEGGPETLIHRARERFPEVTVEVEVDTLDELDAVLPLGVECILLDNMDLDTITQAVRRAQPYRPTKIEVSGGVTLETIASIANTGVDYIAIGQITHSAPALDIGLDAPADPR
ncbi:MAG: carboxylating nicotinate-nucleotide diphosphorylase [Ferrimicrobium sp.]